MDASLLGHLELANWLIQEMSLDIHARNYEGKTALHLGAEQGHEELVWMLLDHPGFGMRPDTLEQAGDDELTPLMLACYKGHARVAKILIKKGNRNKY